MKGCKSILSELTSPCKACRLCANKELTRSRHRHLSQGCCVSKRLLLAQCTIDSHCPFHLSMEHVAIVPDAAIIAADHCISLAARTALYRANGHPSWLTHILGSCRLYESTMRHFLFYWLGITWLFAFSTSIVTLFTTSREKVVVTSRAFKSILFAS